MGSWQGSLETRNRTDVRDQSSGDDGAEPAGERGPRQHLVPARHGTVVETGVAEHLLAHDLEERNAKDHEDKLYVEVVVAAVDAGILEEDRDAREQVDP